MHCEFVRILKKGVNLRFYSSIRLKEMLVFEFLHGTDGNFLCSVFTLIVKNNFSVRCVTAADIANRGVDIFGTKNCLS